MKPFASVVRLMDERPKNKDVITMNSLLKRAQQGDAKAFEELFLPCEGQLYRIAFLYTKNEADALDVMQETAFRAYRNIKTVQDPDYLKSWLTRIAINCALDTIRQRQRFVPLDELPAEPFTDAQEQQILQRVTVQQLLNDLLPQEKTVLLLRYYGDCSLAQIAEQLKLPLGSVKTLLYRTLKKLSAKLEEKDHET